MRDCVVSVIFSYHSNRKKWEERGPHFEIQSFKLGKASWKHTSRWGYRGGKCLKGDYRRSSKNFTAQKILQEFQGYVGWARQSLPKMLRCNFVLIRWIPLHIYIRILALGSFLSNLRCLESTRALSMMFLYFVDVLGPVWEQLICNQYNWILGDSVWLKKIKWVSTPYTKDWFKKSESTNPWPILKIAVWLSGSL